MAAIGEGTAAILIEPIQGEGGIRQPQIAFLEELRRICDEHDLLLIFDEVQTGMGRTGKLFAYEWTKITPDIMTLAKGLGGGFPIGACLATARAASGMLPGTHGSTFGGNPLGCAVANAVLDVLLEDGFLDRVRKVADDLRARLEELAARYPGIILEVRGEGLLIGLRSRAAQYRHRAEADGQRPHHGGGGGERRAPAAAADHRARAGRRGGDDSREAVPGAGRAGSRAMSELRHFLDIDALDTGTLRGILGRAKELMADGAGF